MKGIVQIVPFETLFDANNGLSRADRFERFLANFEGRDWTHDDSGAWIPLHTAIKKHSMFALVAKSPLMDLEVRFSPEAEGGTYSIKRWPKGEIESGKVQQVVVPRPDLEHPRIVKIAGYQHRFVIGSATSMHPIKRLAWIVGLDDPHVVIES